MPVLFFRGHMVRIGQVLPSRSFWVQAIRVLLVALTVLVALGATACTEEGASGPSRNAAPLYVAIGASDSVGTGARDPAREGWVPQLYAKMPAGTRLVNLGIGGLMLHQALEQVLPVAVDLQPSVVTVWLAVNDLAGGVPLDQYHTDLDELLGTLRRETSARVYIANIPDLTALPAFADRDATDLQADILRWNDAIAGSAERNDAVLVDLYAGWQELHERPDYVSRDGFHPSSIGYRRLAEIFWEAMQPA
jgi:acyl-CoA thioesterase-1